MAETGQIRKMAVIIAGSGDSPAANEYVQGLLKGLGGEFETWVAAPKKPSVQHSHYFSSTRKGVEQLLEELENTRESSRVRDVYFYFGGRGGKEGFCLEDCETADLITRLEAVTYGADRVVNSDLPHNRINSIFEGTKKTKVISPGRVVEAPPTPSSLLGIRSFYEVFDEKIDRQIERTAKIPDVYTRINTYLNIARRVPMMNHFSAKVSRSFYMAILSVREIEYHASRDLLLRIIAEAVEKSHLPETMKANLGKFLQSERD